MKPDSFTEACEGLNHSIEEAGKRIMANPDHPASKELVALLRRLREALEPIGSHKTGDR